MFLLVDDAVVVNRGCFRPIFTGNKGNIDWSAAEDFCVNTMKGTLAEFESVEEKDKVKGGFERKYT